MKKRLAGILYIALAFGPMQPSLAQQSTASGAQKGLASLFSSSPKEDELVEPDQAFKLTLAAKGPSAVFADLVPAKGYYLYKDKIRFAVKNSDGVTINAVKLPAGEMKVDQIFGKTEIYRKAIPVEIGLNRTPKAKSVTLVASYQGCHEKLGVCYPPIEKTLTVALQ